MIERRRGLELYSLIKRRRGLELYSLIERRRGLELYSLIERRRGLELPYPGFMGSILHNSIYVYSYLLLQMERQR